MKYLIFTVVLMLLGGCGTTTLNHSQSQSFSLPPGGPERVNAQWSKNCTSDMASNSERCFIGTFGKQADSNGEIIGGEAAPFQIFYHDQDGPYIMLGRHDFPGRSPVLRIGSGDAVEVEHRGLVSLELIEDLKSSDTAFVAYHEWPHGRRNMVVNLSGFEDAWNELLAMVE